MKNLTNLNAAKNAWKWMIVSVISASLLISCSKKNDGGGGDVQALPTVSCVNGQVPPAGYSCIYNGGLYAGSGNLVNNVQFTHSTLGIDGMISLSAMSTSNDVDFNDPRVPAKYSGNISAQGTVNFNTDVFCNGIPLRGNYVLSGAQGMYSWGVLSNFVWTLSGPTTIELRSSGSSVLVGDANGLSRDGMNRLGLSVTVHVNGQYCGYIYTR